MFCYCAQTRRIARTLTARYDAALAPAGITSAQFELLNWLSAMKHASGRKLAASLGTDGTTMSRSLKILLSSGLVASERNKEDGREILYSVTRAGRAALARATPLWRQVDAETGAALGSFAAGAERALRRMSGALADAHR